MRRALVLVIALSLACATAQPDPRADIEHTARQFLAAFENLDWESFRAFFAEDATMFFPAPEPPERFTGRAAIEDHFRKVFDTIRQSSKSSGPPYLRLVPEELRVDLLGPDQAVVTFVMHYPRTTSRRTLVMRREGERWLIVHFHASNAML